MTKLSLTLCLTALAASSLPAQSLSQRILNASDGPIQFSFAARDGVCGDGATYVRDGFGDNNRISEGGNFSGHTRGDDWPPCIAGRVRIVASMSGGQLLRLRTYAGPLRSAASPPRDLGVVSVADATDFLTHVVEQAAGRASNDAILPLVLADSINPWSALLRFARDERLPRSIRSTVDFWLARGASAKLGYADRDDDDEDEVRTQAVFALSQQPKETAVPQLIEIVRHNSRPSVRAQALFWLGQSGDSRAVDLFDDILRRR
jgi:hypothetical protein